MISQLLASESVAVVITVVAGTERAGAKLLVADKGVVNGGLGDAALDHAAANYAEQFQ